LFEFLSESSLGKNDRPSAAVKIHDIPHTLVLPYWPK
jgi:hypothetical protein